LYNSPLGDGGKVAIFKGELFEGYKKQETNFNEND
jgi:hypothetical protein